MSKRVWIEGQPWKSGQRCPRCESPAPHLHPAVQHEGEVQPCLHAYHQQVTPENTPERIRKTHEICVKIGAVA